MQSECNDMKLHTPIFFQYLPLNLRTTSVSCLSCQNIMFLHQLTTIRKNSPMTTSNSIYTEEVSGFVGVDTPKFLYIRRIYLSAPIILPKSPLLYPKLVCQKLISQRLGKQTIFMCLIIGSHL